MKRPYGHTLGERTALSESLVRRIGGHWWIARHLTRLNESERALDLLFRAVNRGYCCHYALLHDSWLDSLRSNSRFLDLVNRAEAMRLEARAVFLDNGGDRLLGVHVP